MIKILIFDNGGVIAGDAWLEFITNIEEKYGTGPGSISAAISAVEVLATAGKISFGSLVEQINNLTNGAEDLSLLYEPKPLNIEVVNYIKELSKDFQVALLTNDLSTFDRDNKLWQLENVFGANIFCSSKMGIRKPDPKIYETTLKSLGVHPSEVVFIDDKERNTLVAEKLGIRTIRFISLEDLKIKLKYILENNNEK